VTHEAYEQFWHLEFKFVNNFEVNTGNRYTVGVSFHVLLFDTTVLFLHLVRIPHKMNDVS